MKIICATEGKNRGAICPSKIGGQPPDWQIHVMSKTIAHPKVPTKEQNLRSLARDHREFWLMKLKNKPLKMATAKKMYVKKNWCDGSGAVEKEPLLRKTVVETESQDSTDCRDKPRIHERKYVQHHKRQNRTRGFRTGQQIFQDHGSQATSRSQTGCAKQPM